MGRGIDGLVDNIQGCLVKCIELVESGSVFQNAKHLSDASIHNENNHSLTLEEIRPKRRVKSKTVYKKKRDVDMNIPTSKIKDISGLDGESWGSINQSFDGMRSEGEHLNEPFKLVMKNIANLTCELIDSAVSECFPSLSSLCAFKIGLTQPQNDTEFQKTTFYTVIKSQYGAYHKLGNTLRDQISSGDLMVSFILPVVLQKCTKSKLPICEMLIEQVFQGYDSDEFWEKTELIESIKGEVQVDPVILMNSCLENIQACNDEHLDYVYGLLDQYHVTHYLLCLELLSGLIKNQIRTLIHPQNLLKESTSLQKHHYIIMEQLSKFMKFTTCITNKNIQFINTINKICQPIKLFGNTMALLEAFFNKNNKYNHNPTSPYEHNILLKILKPEYPITSAFNKYLSQINYESPLIKKDIKLVTGKARYKRAKLSSGDLI